MKTIIKSPLLCVFISFVLSCERTIPEHTVSFHRDLVVTYWGEILGHYSVKKRSKPSVIINVRPSGCEACNLSLLKRGLECINSLRFSEGLDFEILCIVSYDCKDEEKILSSLKAMRINHEVLLDEADRMMSFLGLKGSVLYLIIDSNNKVIFSGNKLTNIAVRKYLQ